MPTESTSCSSPQAAAGFWIRLCSNLLDLILVVLLVVWAARLGSYLGSYIPVEMAPLSAFAVYAPAMFTANKPYYEALGKRAGHSVNSAVEANAFFQDPKNVQ